MKKLNFSLLTLASLLTLTWTFSSCTNDDPNGPTICPTLEYSGCFVVNQGNSSDNIAGSLTLLSLNDYIQELPLTDKSVLGDAPQNAVHLGYTLYVPCYSSSDLAMISLVDATTIGRVKLHGPQHACTDGTYIYVTESDSTLARINPLNTADIKRIKLPGMPYACVYANGNIYINLGTPYGATTVGKSVAVVNTQAGRLTAQIEVGENPYDQMTVDENGNIYTVCFGDYSAPEVWQITHDGYAKKYADGSIIAAAGHKLFVINSVTDWSDWQNPITTNSFKAYDVKTSTTLSTDIYKGEQKAPASPVCMKIATNGDIYVTADGAEGYSSRGKLYIYDSEGLFKAEYTTGVHPYYLTFTD